MKPDCGGGVQYDCGRDWNTTLFLAAHLLPPSVWSCVGLNLGFGLLCFRLHSWHSLQSVLFPHQRGSATVFLLPQPLPDCCVPRAKCLPPAETVCTARHVLHPAPVCSTPSCHPPHHGGAAQRHAGDGVPCSHPSAERQRGHHGYGGGHHYGHVSG